MCCKRTQSVLDLDHHIAHLQADDALTSRPARPVLAADQLQPGDHVVLDGEHLAISHVRMTDLMVILSFQDLDWTRSVSRRRLVRLA
jgi:hypothetical protein